MIQKLRHRQLTVLILMAAVAVMGSVLVGCESSTTAEDYQGVQKSEAFDPSKPVVIQGITPDRGSVGQQICITGSNFGNDTAQVNVTVGGKDAVVVSVKNNAIYAYIPSAAYNHVEGITLKGDVVVSVKDKSAQSPVKFVYERKMVAGRLCGKRYERDADVVWSDGSFAANTEGVSGFKNDGVMQFSPYNHDHLFIVYDQEPFYGTVAHGIQLLDLKNKTVETILPLSMFSNERLRTIDFAVDPYAYNADGSFEMVQAKDEKGQPRVDEFGYPVMVPVGRVSDEWVATATPEQKRWREHLIISADNFDNNYRAHSVYIVDRDADGNFSRNSQVRQLANYQACNGASLHPVNGELYFTSYVKGEVIRLDMDKYWDTLLPDSTGRTGTWDPYVNNNLSNIASGASAGSGAFEILFTVQDTSWEFQIDIHPSGKYAYIVVINRSYILRTDYNENTKRFSAPYVIAGDMSERGFADGVGKSARMRRPYQGTFVKNDEYEAAGNPDIYDFYFCDSENDAIRLLTPEGIVKTYAGGSAATHADGNTYGNENGELRDFARFHRPTGLVNDVHRDAITGENTLIFYILDTRNFCIRTITMEENLEATNDGEDDNTPEP